MSSSDYVVFLVSAIQQEYDSSLLAVGGIKELITSILGFELKISAFAILNLDSPKIKDAQQSYLSTKASLIKQFKSSYINVQHVSYIPVTIHGKGNILAPSKSMGWYTGSVLSDVVLKESLRPRASGPAVVRFSVSEVHREPKVGVSVTGRLRAGTLSPSPEGLLICSPHSLVKLETIHVNGLPQAKMNEGETGDLSLMIREGTNTEINVGTVLAEPDSKDCTGTKEFTAKFFLDSKFVEKLIVYDTFTFHVDQQTFKAQIAHILHTFDARSLKEVEVNPSAVKILPGVGFLANVDIIGRKYPTLTPQKEISSLGRGIITNDEDRIIGYFYITQTRNILDKPQEEH